MEVKVEFTIKAHWAPYGLVIECPNPAARYFVARSLDDNGIVVRVKDEIKRPEGGLDSWQ